MASVRRPDWKGNGWLGMHYGLSYFLRPATRQSTFNTRFPYNEYITSKLYIQSESVIHVSVVIVVIKRYIYNRHVGVRLRWRLSILLCRNDGFHLDLHRMVDLLGVLVGQVLNKGAHEGGEDRDD